MSNEFARNQEDANLTKTKALPAAGATAFTDVWDLGAGAYKLENMEVELSIPATSAHTAGDFVATLVHGATSSPTTSLGMALTQASGTGGGAATSARCRLPSNTLQYVRVSTVSSSGSDGSSVDVAITAKLLF